MDRDIQENVTEDKYRNLTHSTFITTFIMVIYVLFYALYYPLLQLSLLPFLHYVNNGWYHGGDNILEERYRNVMHSKYMTIFTTDTCLMSFIMIIIDIFKLRTTDHFLEETLRKRYRNLILYKIIINTVFSKASHAPERRATKSLLQASRPRFRPTESSQICCVLVLLFPVAS